MAKEILSAWLKLMHSFTVQSTGNFELRATAQDVDKLRPLPGSAKEKSFSVRQMKKIRILCSNAFNIVVVHDHVESAKDEDTLHTTHQASKPHLLLTSIKSWVSITLPKGDENYNLKLILGGSRYGGFIWHINGKRNHS